MEELQSKESLYEDAKGRFDHAWNIPNATRKISDVTFEELLTMFRSDCNSFAEIGALLGVSRERIRQIYNRYFRAVVGKRKTGHVRQHICSLKRHAIAREELPQNTTTRIIVEAAKAAGCTVRQVTGQGQKRAFYLLVHSLLVNGKHCHLFFGNHEFRPFPGIAYLRMELVASSLENMSHAIFLQKIEGYPRRIFIIPATVLRSFLRERTWAAVYIPLERPAHQTRPAKIDFRQYENAWHLLGSMV